MSVLRARHLNTYDMRNLYTYNLYNTGVQFSFEQISWCCSPLDGCTRRSPSRLGGYQRDAPI